MLSVYRPLFHSLSVSWMDGWMDGWMHGAGRKHSLGFFVYSSWTLKRALSSLSSVCVKTQTGREKKGGRKERGKEGDVCPKRRRQSQGRSVDRDEAADWLPMHVFECRDIHSFILFLYYVLPILSPALSPFIYSLHRQP